MVAFSRLQLAAALLEYDNEPDNPSVPFRSAQDSAIFSHMRRAAGTRRRSELERRSTDFLGVSLPSDAGVSQDPTITRKSVLSVDLMQNPFSEEDDGDEADDDVPEVDLASWGLDSFVPKEKGSKASKGKGKAKSEIVLADRRRMSSGNDPRAMVPTRANSEFGVGAAFLDSGSKSPSASRSRQNSLANALADGSGDEYERPSARRRQSAHSVLEAMPVRSPVFTSSQLPERDTIPFPSSSPPPEDITGRPSSRLDAISQGHGRTLSTATMGSLVQKNVSHEEKNPFAVPPPPPSRASRFDPKFQEHVRSNSNATELDPRNERDPQAEGDAVPRSRRLSTASYGTRQMLDNASVMSGDGYGQREKLYSRLELMRPKVLIMPSPLQNPGPATTLEAEKPTRSGFIDTSDGRPLPPGARTSRTMSMIFPSTSAVPVASNSFTPNPRLSLSAAQLLFRNTLMVDGQRDVTYLDIDGNIARAREDGEQVKLEYAEELKPPPLPPPPPPPPVIIEPIEEDKPSRPPGKLLGRSLIDDLEARKAAIRNKQRVFTGDQRPSMMDRAARTSSTLIDPASLQRRPSAQAMESFDASEMGLNRRVSRGSKPLLAFDDDGQLAVTSLRDSRVPKSKSVFGVDMLWEREMEKLKLIEEEERKEVEERERLEKIEQQAESKRKKGKGKKKEEPMPDSNFLAPTEEPGLIRQSSLPHVLPDIPSSLPRRKRNQVPSPNDSDDESSASEVDGVGTKNSLAGRDKIADDWVADEDDISPVRMTGVGPRYPNRLADSGRPFDDDSDEDVPLSVAAARASRLHTPLKGRALVDDDEDEDRPLSALLEKSKQSILTIDFDKIAPAHSPGSQSNLQIPNQDDDDDEPLGIRASRVFSSSKSAHGLDDDDDRPLAMHPEAQKKTQYNMLAQQQLMQNQFHSTFSLGPSQSLIGTPFTPFGPPPLHIAPMMMMPPQPPMLQLQAQDSAKFGRVDRWRHDVAVEGTSS